MDTKKYFVFFFAFFWSWNAFYKAANANALNSLSSLGLVKKNYDYEIKLLDDKGELFVAFTPFEKVSEKPEEIKAKELDEESFISPTFSFRDALAFGKEIVLKLKAEALKNSSSEDSQDSEISALDWAVNTVNQVFEDWRQGIQPFIIVQSLQKLSEFAEMEKLMSEKQVFAITNTGKILQGKTFGYVLGEEKMELIQPQVEQYSLSDVQKLTSNHVALIQSGKWEPEVSSTIEPIFQPVQQGTILPDASPKLEMEVIDDLPEGIELNIYQIEEEWVIARDEANHGYRAVSASEFEKKYTQLGLVLQNLTRDEAIYGAIYYAQNVAKKVEELGLESFKNSTHIFELESKLSSYFEGTDFNSIVVTSILDSLKDSISNEENTVLFSWR